MNSDNDGDNEEIKDYESEYQDKVPEDGYRNKSTVSPKSSSSSSSSYQFPTRGNLLTCSDMVNHAKTKLLMEEKRRIFQLRGKKPFNNNRCAWLKKLDLYINVSEKKAVGPLYSTFLSNGTVRCPRQVYVDSFEAKAQDIKAGHILTDNEFVNNQDGYHTFTEVDWKHLTRMPTDHEIFQYMVVLQILLKQAYPKENVSDYTIRCLRNSPYVKLDSENNPIFSCGFHFVCQGIITISTDNHRIAGLVDIRTLKECSMWHNKTDLSPYHNNNANLRPAYSHKMDPCELCNMELKKAKKMGDVDNDDYDVAEDDGETIIRFNDDNINQNDIDAPKPRNRRARKIYATGKKTKGTRTNNENDDYISRSICGQCYKQKTIQPNHYQLRYELDTNGNFIVIEPGHYSILEEIKLTSIVLQQARDIMTLIPPDDMPTVVDLQTEKYNKGTNKKIQTAQDAQDRLMSELKQGSKLTDQIKFLSLVINRFISSVNSNFAHIVAVYTPMENKKARGGKLDFLVVKLRGKGAKFCLLQKEEHKSNHCFYKLKSTGVMYFHCHDPQCKPILAGKRDDPKFQSIEMKLTIEENRECMRHFGFAGINTYDLLDRSVDLLDVNKRREFNADEMLLTWVKQNQILSVQKEGEDNLETDVLSQNQKKRPKYSACTDVTTNATTTTDTVDDDDDDDDAMKINLINSSPKLKHSSTESPVRKELQMLTTKAKDVDLRVPTDDEEEEW